MGKLGRGILSGFSGKLGIVNGYRSQKRDIIRSIPSQRIDAKTPAQLSQRGRYTQTGKFLNRIYHPLIHDLMSVPRGTISAYFKFFKYNSEYFDSTGFHSPDSLIISRGSLLPVQNFHFVSIPGANIVRYAYSNNSDGINAFENDIFRGITYNYTLDSIQCFDHFPLRSATYFDQEFPDDWRSFHSLYSYITFISANSLRVADSIIISH